MELLIALGIGAALLLLGQQLNRLALAQHHQRLDRHQVALLHSALELLQLVQKHRALGGQSDPTADLRREELARQLDRLWRDWDQTWHEAPRQSEWIALRQAPRDFQGHCRLIERLLTTVHQLELQLSLRQGRQVAGIGEACRGLEDLGRLRGLSVRAAHHARCPLDLQVQLRYLCQRLTGPTASGTVLGVVERLRRDLIETSAVALAPTDCFALITPIIDGRLQTIRQSLGHVDNGHT